MEIYMIGAALGGAVVGGSVVAIVFVKKVAKLQAKVNELLEQCGVIK